MTFYQVSQRSERKYGRSSLYFLPHNLYSDLRGGTFSPSIYQFLALSRIAGYRLPGWVRVFGADLENIADILPSRRSILLDSWLTNPYVPGFHGSETESGTALRLPSRHSVSCCSSLAPNGSVPCPKARVGVTGGEVQPSHLDLLTKSLELGQVSN